MDELEKPPVFEKWSSWYILVLLVMLAQVIFFWFITNYFA